MYVVQQQADEYGIIFFSSIDFSFSMTWEEKLVKITLTPYSRRNLKLGDEEPFVDNYNLIKAAFRNFGLFETKQKKNEKFSLWRKGILFKQLSLPP